MTWADLDKLAAGKPRASGGVTLVIKDERTAAQIADAPHVSVLIAISRVTRARQLLRDRHDGLGVVVYLTIERPPSFLLEAITSAGGVAFDGKQEHAWPKPSATTVLLDAAMCDLAIAVRRRIKVRTFADVLEVRESELRHRRPAPTDHVAWWTAVLELMAVTGEVLRAERPGKWSINGTERLPLGLDFGRGDVALLGTDAEAVLAGDRAQMLGAVVAPVSIVTLDQDMRLIPLLCDRRRLPSADVISELLVSAEVDTPELPIVCFVEDRDDDTIRWPRSAELLPAARARAIASLGDQPYEIETTRVSEVGFSFTLVTGCFYAAEALLHRPTMQMLEAELGGETLLVGVPARGHLIATSALLSDELLDTLLLMIEKHYLEAPEADRISSELIVYLGKPVGRVQSNIMDVRRALRAQGVDPDAIDR